MNTIPVRVYRKYTKNNPEGEAWGVVTEKRYGLNSFSSSG